MESGLVRIGLDIQSSPNKSSPLTSLNASAFVAEQLAWRSLLVDQLLALPFRLQSETITSQYTKMCDVRFVSIPGFVWCHFDGGVREAVPNFDYGLEDFWPPLMVESRGN